MMKRFFVILISCLWLAVPLSAQSNKLIRELESKRGALQKQIAESESILKLSLIHISEPTRRS